MEYRMLSLKVIFMTKIWISSIYHIGDQLRLSWASASVQSRQSIRRCSHAWNMEVNEGSDQNQISSLTGWLRMRVWRMRLHRTKNTIIHEMAHFGSPTRSILPRRKYKCLIPVYEFICCKRCFFFFFFWIYLHFFFFKRQNSLRPTWLLHSKVWVNNLFLPFTCLIL